MAPRKHPGNPPIWTPDQCVEALQRWVAEHGYVPASMKEWRLAAYGRPTARTCQRHFGTWRAFVLAAGLTPRRPGSAAGYSRDECVVTEDGRLLYWTRERICEWMLDHLLREGRWPTVMELRRATDEKRPSWCSVRRQFGSFTAAKRAAGWRSECVCCGKPLPNARASQLFCSKKCVRKGRAQHVDPTCAGCGADLDSYSTGCTTCWDRRRRRARRAQIAPALSPGTASPRLADDGMGRGEHLKEAA